MNDGSSDPHVQMELLEARLLRDGTVHASIIDGDLVVRGDDEDNALIVQRVAGKVRVRGVDGTHVNGGAVREFDTTFDDLEILLRQGGVDEITIHGGMKVNGDVVTYFGDGELVAEGSAGTLEIGGNLIVRGGDDGDVHVRNAVVVRGRADISTGGAADMAAARAKVPDFASARFSHPLDIDNPYFPLVPGTTCTYEEKSSDDETGETVTERIVVEVTNQTKTVLGVTTRVLRDRVFLDGLLVEDTFDWHAQDDDGNVWYFGEESTDFEYDDEGNLIDTSTETSWKAGVNGAKAGIIMEAGPRVGDRYYQEFAPNRALDYAAVLATAETVTGSVGTFKNVVRTADLNLLEPSARENKYYAPGLGLVQEVSYDLLSGEADGTLRLLAARRNGQDITTVVPPTGFTGTNATGTATARFHVFGETLIRAGGEVVIDGGRFGDELEIDGESTVAVVNSLLEDLTIFADDTIGVRAIEASEEVELRGDVDVFIFASDFDLSADVRLGDGDNTLAVRGSSFERLFADGGDGENEFDDRGRNVFDEMELRNFEG